MRATLAVWFVGCTYSAPATTLEDGPISDSPLDTPVDMPDAPVDSPPTPFWQNIVGAAAVANSLTDTATTGWGKSGASTIAQINSGNGFLEFSTAENDKTKAFGLSNGDSNLQFKDIDFSIQLRANQSVFIFEGSANLGQASTYVAGDVFRVEVANNVVTYRQNGNLLRTSLRIPAFPLLGDAALYDVGSTITDATIVPE